MPQYYTVSVARTNRNDIPSRPATSQRSKRPPMYQEDLVALYDGKNCVRGVLQK